MNIGIAIEIDNEADKKSALIQQFSDSLSKEFKNKNYGEHIENINIGLICQRTVPGFEAFQVKRKPQYIVSEQVLLLDGTYEEIKHSFNFDIKLDDETYEAFVHSTGVEAFEILKMLLWKSLHSFDSLPKKVKKFDLEKFKLDLADFLERV